MEGEVDPHTRDKVHLFGLQLALRCLWFWHLGRNNNFVELCMGFFVGSNSCGCTRIWLGRMGQSLLKGCTLPPPLLCRWRHFRKDRGCSGLRSKGGRLRSTVSWNDQHAYVGQEVCFEGDAKCLKVVIYYTCLGPSQWVVDIVTIFKDNRRVTANLGELDIKIVWKTKFAANDASHIIKRML